MEARRWVVPAWLALSTVAFGAPLSLNLKPGQTVRYRVTSKHKETDSGNVTLSQSDTQMPIALYVLSKSGGGTQVRVETGPLFALGRSVGRAKVKQMEIDANGSVRGIGPSWFFVTLPPGGAKAGQSWSGRLNAPTSLPAGLIGNYRLNGLTADGKFAKVSFATSMLGATRVQGSGLLFLRTSDGCLDHGKIKVNIAYIRPDMKDRSKSLVHSRVVIDYTILPK